MKPTKPTITINNVGSWKHRKCIHQVWYAIQQQNDKLFLWQRHPDANGEPLNAWHSLYTRPNNIFSNHFHMLALTLVTITLN